MSFLLPSTALLTQAILSFGFNTLCDRDVGYFFLNFFHDLRMATRLVVLSQASNNAEEIVDARIRGMDAE